MKGDFIFTSESVTEGHPDKLCDQISDGLVDRFLQQDPFSQITAECAVATGILFIAARFASDAVVDIAGLARRIIIEAGYDHSGFDPNTCSVMTSLSALPAGDRFTRDEAEMDDDEMERMVVQNQATVFGFACTQTPGLMPLPIWLAHKIARRLATVRKEGQLPYLAPDGKTQVAVEYRDGRAARIHGITLVAAISGDAVPEQRQLERDLDDLVVRPAFAEEEVRPDDRTRLFINPGGPLMVGGPATHAGLTGRKNGIDTYGEYARQSDSALSGKDPTRIARSGTYAARHAAVNVVSAGLASECEVQLSYSIGLSRPVSLQVQTFGSGRIPDAEIAARLDRTFDFRLAGIIRDLRLRRLPALARDGFYRKLAAYGQVGRTDLDLPWEKPDRTAALRD
ncbi:MAG: methionine adenosyltransferase [Rhodospirillales bacterium]|nr:MAG: methionine adenosyltransferase [Rhodospirillales bacterium]